MKVSVPFTFTDEERKLIAEFVPSEGVTKAGLATHSACRTFVYVAVDDKIQGRNELYELEGD